MLDQAKHRSNLLGLTSFNKKDYEMVQSPLTISHKETVRRYIALTEWIIELVIRSKFQLYDPTLNIVRWTEEKLESGELVFIKTGWQDQSIVHMPTSLVLLTIQGLETRYNPATSATNLHLRYRVHKDPLYYNPVTGTHQEN